MLKFIIMKFAQFEPIQLNSSPSLEEIQEYYTKNYNPDWEEVLKPYLSLPDLPKSNSTPFQESELDSKPKKWVPKQVIEKIESNKENLSSNPADIVIPTKNTVITSIQNLPISQSNKDYLIKMAGRESNYNLLITNQIGAKGLYQFIPSTLAHLGLDEEDLKDPVKQHYAALKLNQQNKITNSSIFENLVGKKISKDSSGKWLRNPDGTLKFTDDGIEITENGLLAVHALLGAGGVRDWVNNTSKTWTGRHNHSDQNGTDPEPYLKLFTDV